MERKNKMLRIMTRCYGIISGACLGVMFINKSNILIFKSTTILLWVLSIVLMQAVIRLLDINEGLMDSYRKFYNLIHEKVKENRK